MKKKTRKGIYRGPLKGMRWVQKHPGVFDSDLFRYQDKEGYFTISKEKGKWELGFKPNDGPFIDNIASNKNIAVVKRAASQKSQSPSFNKNPEDLQQGAPLLNLLAAFRGAYEVQRNSHWRASGNDAYGNHLLLQRIYEDTSKNVDNLAERYVGLFGASGGAVNAGIEGTKHLDQVNAFAKDFTRYDPMTSAWLASSELNRLLKETYEEMKYSGDMTPGLDDLLLSIASNVEEHLYLLQQAENLSPPKLKAKLLR